jgi:hypothetical protein
VVHVALSQKPGSDGPRCCHGLVTSVRHPGMEWDQWDPLEPLPLGRGITGTWRRCKTPGLTDCKSVSMNLRRRLSLTTTLTTVARSTTATTAGQRALSCLVTHSAWFWLCGAPQARRTSPDHGGATGYLLGDVHPAAGQTRRNPGGSTSLSKSAAFGVRPTWRAICGRSTAQQDDFLEGGHVNQVGETYRGSCHRDITAKVYDELRVAIPSGASKSLAGLRGDECPGDDAVTRC